MKVEQEQKVFNPVKLILETQEEVDKVFALFNFEPIASYIMGFQGSHDNPLKGLCTEQYSTYHYILCKMK